METAKEKLAWANKMLKAHKDCDHSHKTTCTIKVGIIKRVIDFINPLKPFN